MAADKPSGGGRPHLMLVAGEPSGDALGGQLMASLKALTGGEIEITGAGGAAMEAEGLTSLFPITDTAVMGLTEIAPSVPRILARVRQMADHAEQVRPDAVVLIDSPAFTHRIAGRLARRRSGIKVIKYVAPQVWASRPWRARELARIVDLLLALLPFEPAFFERYGLKTRFVGHPVIERAAQMTGGAAFRARHAIAQDAPLLGVLPGSRRSEITQLAPIFADTVTGLAAALPDLRVVIPTLPHVSESVRAAFASSPGAPVVLDDPAERYPAFVAANAALAASGTVSTELALARTPMVIGFKAGAVTAAVFRPLFIAPYATLVNLIAADGVIPEFLQEACTPQNLTREVFRLLTDQEVVARQLAGIDRVLAQMGLGEEAPSMRAAQAVLEEIGWPRGAS